MTIRTALYLTPGLASLVILACGGNSPTEPSQPAAPRAGEVATAVQHQPNRPPVLRLNTTPPHNKDTTPWSITGSEPLTVEFRLCPSSDPDKAADDLPTAGQGDTINWQFHWGDDGKPLQNPDGSYNWNFAGACDPSHEYAKEGRYIATLSVTDKHLDDQSRDVSSTARVMVEVAINVTGVPAGNSTNRLRTVKSPESSSIWG